VQPRRFFQHLHRLFAEDLGFVLSAYKEGRIIASAVFLAWNGSLVYKYSASDYEHRRLCGSNAVLWNAISWACEQGLRTLDFGRTDSDNEGLRNFKRSWGAEEQQLTYTYIGQEPVREPSTSLLLSAVRPAIRHGPLWVGRAIGRLGYRRAV
jgi:lipid II:glycine glycyltransferase (peptidoglycan interpeptide bridge formation enzyme)